MLIIGKLLLLIIAVTGTLSEPQRDLSEQDNISEEVSRAYKNYNHPPLFEVLDGADSGEIEVRKVRDATENSGDLVTRIPVTVNSPEPIQRGNITPNGTFVKVKRRKQPKQQPSTENKGIPGAIPIEKRVVPESTQSGTERTVTTSPVPRTVVPKTFTKRPPEYNPIFKKIRQRDPVVKIVDETNFVFSHSGNFHYSYEGGDGTKVSSEGELKSFDDDRTGEAVIGSVFYKDDEGNDVSLSYTADENGYRAYGAHLPTPPPIPPAIARALKYLATATTPEPVTKPTIKKN
ncbi:endocuticle structural glycoprotein SgAbd-1-like [Pararge aegeria]|uniref:endocuticle structural glycoprotein SgAbd-1-like n=1 Tax=Pararge aegeria TaxID=116150 RepID=UPI0019D0B32F|nr:endocuticle structural glycoprotein SgAbd-1-like [Pararge aegeria]